MSVSDMVLDSPTHDATASDAAVPRLLYFGNVPVEQALHGSAQLFRLLETWPAAQLLVVESATESRPALRLRGVDYRRLRPSPPLQQRLATIHFVVKLRRYLKALERAVGSYSPDAILSVAHGREWILAYLYARRHGVPLHLIVHDAGTYARNVFGRIGLHRLEERIFGHVYRHAASRLCVSPYMEQDYRRRYGVEGTVLLPSVGMQCPRYSTSADSSERARGPFRVAFAGSINELLGDLGTLAECLHDLDCELLVYGGSDVERARIRSAAAPAVRLMPFLSTEAELVESLRSEADIAFLPVTFDPAVRENMRLNFPSKLTAYTAAGLPVLVRGPADSSAVKWSTEHSGFAYVITDPDQQALRSAMRELLQNAGLRKTLADHSLRICDRFFRHKRAEAAFLQAVEGPGRRAPHS